MISNNKHQDHLFLSKLSWLSSWVSAVQIQIPLHLAMITKHIGKMSAVMDCTNLAGFNSSLIDFQLPCVASTHTIPRRGAKTNDMKLKLKLNWKHDVSLHVVESFSFFWSWSLECRRHRLLYPSSQLSQCPPTRHFVLTLLLLTELVPNTCRDFSFPPSPHCLRHIEINEGANSNNSLRNSQ